MPLITPFSYNINTQGQDFNSLYETVEPEIVESEQFEGLLQIMDSYSFDLIENNPGLKFFREIESFVNLDNNWDGYDAVPLSERVAEKGKTIIENIKETFLTSNLYHFEIKPTPYSTLILDWYNENSELSIEIGKDEMGYFYETPIKSGEIESLNISSTEDIKNAIIEIESLLVEFF